MEVGLRAGRFVEVRPRADRFVEAYNTFMAMVEYVHDVMGCIGLIMVMRLYMHFFILCYKVLRVFVLLSEVISFG